jgi:hypothetical protein
MTTVAIIDYAHSGTTMVAGLCHILGVPMVFDDYKRHKLEDLDVLRAIDKEQEFARLVKERDEQYGVWGFKRPGAWTFPDALAHLQDPIYLVIYKDPVTVTYRRFRKIRRWMVSNTLEQMRVSMDGIKSNGLPVHILSYQRAILTPETFVKELAGIIGVTVGDKLAEAVGWIQPNKAGKWTPYPRLPQ